MTTIELYFSKKYDLIKSLTVTFTLIVAPAGTDEADVTIVEFGPGDVPSELGDFLMNSEMFQAALAKFEGERLEFMKEFYPDRYDELTQ